MVRIFNYSCTMNLYKFKYSLRWFPIAFLTTRQLISKILRWRELSNSTQKLRAKSRSKMPTNLASKLLKFV